MREPFRRQRMLSPSGLAMQVPSRRKRKMSRALQRDLTMRRMLQEASANTEGPTWPQREPKAGEPGGERVVPERAAAHEPYVRFDIEDKSVVLSEEDSDSAEDPGRGRDAVAAGGEDGKAGEGRERGGEGRERGDSLGQTIMAMASRAAREFEYEKTRWRRFNTLSGGWNTPRIRAQTSPVVGQVRDPWREEKRLRSVSSASGTRGGLAISTLVDEEFLHGNDFRVPLTASQRRHYHLIFQMNDHNVSGQLEVAELCRFIDASGHGVSMRELKEMFREVGIDEDDNGAIDEAEFFEFIRRTLVADLPASKVPLIHSSFENAVNTHTKRSGGAEPPSEEDKWDGERRPSDAPPLEAVTRPETRELLRMLGFHLDDLTFNEVFDDLDTDDDGALTLEEFITCIGMLKKSVLEVRELEGSFTRFRSSAKGRGAGGAPGAAPVAEGPTAGEHKIFARDLVAALGVSEEVAEEMIYIAALQEDECITFTEFRQVVVNWD